MASVTVRGRFEEGKKVELYPGGDFFNPAITNGKAIASATVKDGEATFDGKELAAGQRFFAVQEIGDEFRHATVTAKDKPPARRRQSADVIATELRGTLPAHNEGSGVITGPRSTGNATLDNPTPEQRAEAVIEQSAIPAAHEPTKGGPPDEPHPRIKQADVPAKQPQRTSTPMGEGHPVDPDEHQPRLPQSAVPEGTQQMSDTPLGEATPVDPKDVQPATRQEDVPESTPQRTDTETGTAFPVPQGDPVDVARARDSSDPREREKAEKPKRRRSAKKKPAKKAAARKAPAKKRPRTAAQKAASRKRSAQRAKARKAKGG